MSENRDVQSVGLDRNIAFLDDGTVLEITDFFDEDGEACDADSAVTCVATDNNHWWVIDLTCFETATQH